MKNLLLKLLFFLNCFDIIHQSLKKKINQQIQVKRPWRDGVQQGAESQWADIQELHDN